MTVSLTTFIYKAYKQQCKQNGQDLSSRIVLAAEFTITSTAFAISVAEVASIPRFDLQTSPMTETSLLIMKSVYDSPCICSRHLNSSEPMIGNTITTWVKFQHNQDPIAMKRKETLFQKHIYFIFQSVHCSLPIFCLDQEKDLSNIRD